MVEHSRKLLFPRGDTSSRISSQGERTATENGARNNPRRNNATRQIVSVEIFLLDVCLVKNLIVVQFPGCDVTAEFRSTRRN